MTGLKSYLRISDNVFPKILEKFYLLEKNNDELFELSKEAFLYILSFKDGRSLTSADSNKRFINTLLKQSILVESFKRKKRTFILNRPPLPSLRYLEIQLTSRCNIKCKHCYQGDKADEELPFDELKKILEEFISFQGLRVLLSGGEPLLYSKLKDLNTFLKGYGAYVVLITNGTLLNDIPLSYISNIDEVQISLDGMEEGHDFLRGEGTFKKVIGGIRRLKEKTDKKISFATMVHNKNLNDFKKLKRLIKSFDAKEWGIDYPVFTGYFKKHKDLYPPIDSAIEVMRYRFGASYHSTEEKKDYACGVHTMTLMPTGNFVPCGFYPDKIFGNIKEGLAKALKNRVFFKLSDILECNNCQYIYDCRGGCRYRAGGIDKKDFLMCKIFGR